MVQVYTNGHSSDSAVLHKSVGAMAERPYLYLSGGDTWTVCNPSVKAGDQQENGAQDIDGECVEKDRIAFSKVAIINPDDVNTPSKWSDLMSQVGTDKTYQVVILTPGLYEVASTINVNAGAVLLGVGYPTLQFGNFNGTSPGISAVSSKKVRLAGIVLQADNAVGNVSSFVKFGDGKTDVPTSYEEAGVLNDVFLRTFGWADKMLEINDPFAIVKEKIEKP